MELNEISVELLSPDRNALEFAELADLVNSVYRVAEADFWQEGYLRTDKEAMGKAVERSEIIAASWRGELLACIYTTVIGSGVFEFGMLSVPPKYEGKGIGRMLISAAEAYALSCGSRKMRLQLLTPVEGKHAGKQQLLDWYLRMGYGFIEQIPFERVAPEDAKFLKMPCFFDIYDKNLA